MSDKNCLTAISEVSRLLNMNIRNGYIWGRDMDARWEIFFIGLIATILLFSQSIKTTPTTGVASSLLNKEYIQTHGPVLLEFNESTDKRSSEAAVKGRRRFISHS